MSWRVWPWHAPGYGVDVSSGEWILGGLLLLVFIVGVVIATRP